MSGCVRCLAAFVLAGLVTLVFAGAAAQREYRIGDAFVFTGPADLSDTGAHGFDSMAGVRANPLMRVEYDYGRYSSDLSEFAGASTVRRAGTLDGREAWFVETPALAAVHVPAVRTGTRFTLLVFCSGRAQREQALALIHSIRFLPPTGPKTSRAGP